MDEKADMLVETEADDRLWAEVRVIVVSEVVVRVENTTVEMMTSEPADVTVEIIS